MVLKLYVTALQLIRPLVHCGEMADNWERPSLLQNYTVGTLMAHLVVTVTRVVDVVRGAELGFDPIDPQQSRLAASQLLIAARLKQRADVYGPVHGGVRRTAVEIAETGPSGVASRFDASLAALEQVRPDLPEDRVVEVPMPARMPLGDWLSTRLVEIVVHADDLTESLGLAPVTFPTEIMDQVIAALVGAIRERVGDHAVVVALARAERAAPDVLRAL